MATERQCEVKGCARTFIPGKGGAADRCWMHYRRRLRNSPNADVPGEIRDGSRCAKLTVYTTEAAETSLRKLADARAKKLRREVSVSELVAEEIDRALARIRHAERRRSA